MKKSWIPCSSDCLGWNWFSSDEIEQDLRIEKCDECGRFETDEDARKFAYIEINRKSAVIEILKTYSEGDRLTAAWMLLGQRRFR